MTEKRDRAEGRHILRSFSHWLRLAWLGILSVLLVLSLPESSHGAGTVETFRVKVLRVHFSGTSATPEYGDGELQGFLNSISELWRKNSYGRLNIEFDVSEMIELSHDRSYYINDTSAWDTSKDILVLANDAVVNAPADFDWTGVGAVLVVMSEEDDTQLYIGEGVSSCSLQVGPFGSYKTVGCAVVGENPLEPPAAKWGRWAHEIGHALQQSGPGHPSGYNSEFELMDNNLPGQSGVFEKQAHTGFPGWLSEYKYVHFDPTSGGGTSVIWASEYPPVGRPNPQAVKVEMSESVYYLLSVRRKILGDELNAKHNGIPDEGVLIERVEEVWNSNDPWVKVIGRGKDASCGAGECNRNQLWTENEVFISGEGVRVKISKQVNADNYVVHVAYEDQAMAPDVMLYPWRSPPGNTWETTDIWIDSPLNGYGAYRYGHWNDVDGQLVPRGNGDDPAVGLVNRVYARVRNLGHAPAINVRVIWEVTDPPGVGINGAIGWEMIGGVDKEDFPGLATIEAGSYVDVYVEWTPDFPIKPADMAAGRFAFHTCLRAKVGHVAGEMVFGNQDGVGEQENIAYYQAPVVSPGGPIMKAYHHVMHLRNDEARNKRFLLSYETDVPLGWTVVLNKNEHSVELGPNEVRSIPVSIAPGRSRPRIGSVFKTDVSASYRRVLVNALDKNDVHVEYAELGGARVESRVLKQTTLACKTVRASRRKGYSVEGVLNGTGRYGSTKTRPLEVMVVGVDANNRLISELGALVPVAPDGTFKARVSHPRRRSRRGAPAPKALACMFAGTDRLTSAASAYLRLH